MICEQSSLFFMVANAGVEAGIPCDFLVRPPRAIHADVKDAEAEAVRLATKFNDRFFLIQAVAYVDVVDGVPKWTEVKP